MKNFPTSDPPMDDLPSPRRSICASDLPDWERDYLQSDAHKKLSELLADADTLDAAADVLRRRGKDTVTTRSIAKAMNSMASKLRTNGPLT